MDQRDLYNRYQVSSSYIHTNHSYDDPKYLEVKTLVVRNLVFCIGEGSEASYCLFLSFEMSLTFENYLSVYQILLAVGYSLWLPFVCSN